MLMVDDIGGGGVYSKIIDYVDMGRTYIGRVNLRLTLPIISTPI